MVLARVTPPKFGRDENVGVKFESVLENPRTATPAIDTGVEIKSCHAHRPRILSCVWQSLSVESVDLTFAPRMWWVDAFIGEHEHGNPAVVVLLERSLPDVDLQQIAFEMGVSETAFVRRSGEQWSLRWFTPTTEVDLCGHATLAAIHVLVRELAVASDELYFHTRSGVLSGRLLRDGLLGMDLPRRSAGPVDPAVLNGVFGEVTEAYQGGAHIVLALVKDYESLCQLTINPVDLFVVPGSLVVALCEGGPDVDLSIRVFAPRLGLGEDPVTGSAMCALAPWWMERSGSPTLSVRQASSRGGLMHARLFERNVEIAGLARTFVSGEIRV